MKKFLILTGSWVVFVMPTFGCDCNYGGSFIKMAPHTRFVALVKVIKYLSFKDIYEEKTPMSMEVEIVEILKGIESRKTITVWGDPGNLCRPYLSTFKEGQYFVIAFNNGSPNYGHEKEKVTDYTISNCGAFWLSVDIEKKLAIGDINSNNRKVSSASISNLIAELKKNGH